MNANINYTKHFLFWKLRNGEAAVEISTDLLKNHLKIGWFPDGKRLFIEAKVIEQATGHEEKALDSTTYFTNTPLKISFRRSSKFFKPGVPFEVKVRYDNPFEFLSPYFILIRLGNHINKAKDHNRLGYGAYVKPQAWSHLPVIEYLAYLNAGLLLVTEVWSYLAWR